MEIKYSYTFALIFLFFCLPNYMQLHGQGLGSFLTGDPVNSPAPAPPSGTSRDFLPVSPSAASLGTYGQIPVNNYTGMTLVTVPLYTINYKELSVPISINYHSSGVKPDLFPGNIGLGWNIQAGGSISRVINGSPDFEGYEHSNGDRLIPDDTDPAHARDNWSSDVTLEESLCKGCVLKLDDFNDPDEFYYNVNGVSGKFYMNHRDSFRIQSTDGASFLITKDIQYEKTYTFPFLKQSRDNFVAGNMHYKNSITKREVLNGFTMTDAKGIEYKFGGDDHSIEFSRPGFQTPSDGDSTMVIPMTWYLKSIKSPNGYEIMFDYNQEVIISKVRFSDVALYVVGSGIIMNSTPLRDATKATFINGCVPSSITFPNGKVVFSSSVAHDQLDYPSYLNFFDQCDFGGYQDIARANTAKVVNPYDPMESEVKNRFFPHRIDSIAIYSIENQDLLRKQIRKIRFNYTNSKQERLKLLSLNIGTENENIQNYQFSYYQSTLPPYFSHQTDYYGYWNATTLFEYGDDSYTRVLQENPNDILEKKKPRGNYSMAQLLEKVIYPTGGYTHFEYEPHYYGSTYSIWPFEVKLNPSGNEQTGGMRIRKITNYDNNPESQPTEKIYHYVKNYLSGQQISSGVLAYIPTYIESYEGQVDSQICKSTTTGYVRFFRWSTNPIFPMVTKRGSHITYTEVTMEEPGKGFTVYKYKNYDNGYADKPLINRMADHASLRDFTLDEEGISMNLERGQILSEEIYATNKIFKKKIIYTYNDNPDRFDEHVRFLRMTTNSLDLTGTYNSKRIIAGVHYTYFPYLKNKKEYTYLNTALVQDKTFTYNEKYRLPKTENIINSFGQNILTEYQYPFEYAETDSVYKRMTRKHMVAYPLEIIQKVNGLTQEKKMNIYSDAISTNGLGHICLHKEMIQYPESPIREEVIYKRYDTYGNPLEIEYLSSERICLLWSYNGVHPVAMIEGVTYAEIEQKLGSQFITRLANCSYPSETEIEAIRSLLAGDSPIQITTYFYEYMVGLISSTDPRGVKINYEYDDYGRLKAVYDHNGDIVEKYDYHYKY